jgi:hypothetical protein
MMNCQYTAVKNLPVGNHQENEDLRKKELSITWAEGDM